MSAGYLDVSVQETDSAQGHRECANAINYLLGRQPTVAMNYGLAVPAFAISNASPGTIVAPWAGTLGSAYAEADQTTGIVTVKETGLYSIQATVVFQNGTLNESYVLELIHTVLGVPGYTPMATAEWTNKTTAASLSGSLTVAMGVDDQVAIAIYGSVVDTLNLISGQLLVQQL